MYRSTWMILCINSCMIVSSYKFNVYIQSYRKSRKNESDKHPASTCSGNVNLMPCLHSSCLQDIDLSWGHYLPQKVPCRCAPIDVTFVEWLFRIVWVKLTRLFAQGPVELELDHEAHEVPESICKLFLQPQEHFWTYYRCKQNWRTDVRFCVRWWYSTSMSSTMHGNAFVRFLSCRQSIVVVVKGHVLCTECTCNYPYILILCFRAS